MMYTKSLLNNVDYTFSLSHFFVKHMLLAYVSVTRFVVGFSLSVLLVIFWIV